MRLQSWDVEYSFITITLTSTLIQCSSTCVGTIYGQIENFNISQAIICNIK